MAVVVVAVTANEQEQSASRSNRGGRRRKMRLSAAINRNPPNIDRARGKKMTVYSMVQKNVFKGCVM